MVDFLMRRSVAVVALLSFILLAPTGASAATPDEPVHMGYTTSVVEDVKGQLGDAPAKRIVKAEKVFFNQAVITATDSAVVIQFRDGSTFELGPNGVMTLDEMVFNPFESKSVKVMTLVQGSFRYVSGYVAKDALAELKTPLGTIGIRGSTMSGFHYPGQPEFLHVSKGEATYSNDAGQSTVGAGQSVAVVDRTTPTIEPERMPPAVAAQALSHIESNLGEASAAAAAQTLTPEQRAADAAANAVPTALQQQALPTVATAPIAAPLPASEAPAIPLLTEAASVGVLDARNTEATAQQQAFLAKAEQAIPDAAARIEAVTAADQAKNEANVAVGTTEVIAGSSENAASAEQIGALVQASVGANPDATALIATTAVKSSAANAAVETAAVAQATTKGAVSGAVAAGADLGEITKAAASGAIAGAIEAGADAVTAAQAATQGAVSGAAEAGVDLGVAAKAATEGVVAGAVAAGVDAVSIIEASTRGAVTATVASGGDVSAVTTAVIQGVEEIATAIGIDAETVTTIVQTQSSEAEIEAIEQTAPPPDPTLEPTVLEPVDETLDLLLEEPVVTEPENPSQDTASPN